MLGELKHEQICSDPEVCHRDGVFRGDHASVTEMSLPQCDGGDYRWPTPARLFKHHPQGNCLAQSS